MCKEEIVKKCLHGKTQNTNESFNGTIWNLISKATHVGLSTLCSGVSDVVSHFSYGQIAVLDPGIYMTKSCSSINKKRKHKSSYKTSSPQKKRRKILRHSSKKGNDKVVEEEGTSYEAGGF